MTKKERYKGVIDYFSVSMPTPETELTYRTPFELLIAVILSAQCTDKRVNQVTPALFERFPTPELLANATFEEVFEYIKSVSYPNNKAKHLIGCAKLLLQEFQGEIPDTIENLQKLPGVGRKTANVVVSVIYQQPTMAVDTHVFRVSKRIGLVAQKASTPLAVEKELIKYIPADIIPKAHHWLILHGRYTCKARQPDCYSCGIQNLCAYYSASQKKKKNN